MKTRVCSICARGGSKGVPGKNIKLLLGIPLIGYSIKQAKDSGLFEYIAVSSDSDEILNVAKEYGADIVIKRPDEMANDGSAKIPAIIHCIKEVENLTGKTFETVVDLDATSPLRSIEDIQNVVMILENENVENVVTAMPSRRSPYFNMVEIKDGGRVGLVKEVEGGVVRRQDSPNCYDMNASIYAWKKESLYKSTTSVFLSDTRLYIMPEERSIDIDSETDFEIVEFFMKRKELNNGK